MLIQEILGRKGLFFGEILNQNTGYVTHKYEDILLQKINIKISNFGIPNHDGGTNLQFVWPFFEL